MAGVHDCTACTTNGVIAVAASRANAIPSPVNGSMYPPASPISNTRSAATCLGLLVSGGVPRQSAHQIGRETDASMSENLCDNYGRSAPQQCLAIDGSRYVILPLTHTRDADISVARQNHRELSGRTNGEVAGYDAPMPTLEFGATDAAHSGKWRTLVRDKPRAKSRLAV